MTAEKRKSFTDCSNLISGAIGEKCNTFNTALEFIQVGSAIISVNTTQAHPFIFLRNLKDINARIYDTQGMSISMETS